MKKILIYLFDGFEMFEYASLTNIFAWNNILNKEKIIFFSISHKENISSLWSGEIKTMLYEKNFNSDSLKDFDALLIPGGFGSGRFFNDKNNEFFLDILKYFRDKNKIIGAICSASIILAESNLFENRKFTTYMLENKRYFNQLEKFNVIPVYEEFVVDNNLISVSGPKNSIDLAFYLVEKFSNIDNVKKIKENMMFKK